MTTWAAARVKATKMNMERKPNPSLDPTVKNATDEQLNLTPVTVDHRQKVHDRPMVADWWTRDAAEPALNLKDHVEEVAGLIPERIRDSTVVQCATRGNIVLTTFHFPKRFDGPLPFCKGAPHIVKFSSGRGIEVDKKAFQLVLEEWGDSRYTGYALSENAGGQRKEWSGEEVDEKYDWLRDEVAKLKTEEEFEKWFMKEQGDPKSKIHSAPPMREPKVKALWEKSKGGARGATFIADWPLRLEHFVLPVALLEMINRIIAAFDSKGVIIHGPRKIGKTLLLMTLAFMASAAAKERFAGDPCVEGPIGFWFCTETDDLPRNPMKHHPMLIDEIASLALWTTTMIKSLLDVIGIGKAFKGRYLNVQLPQGLWRSGSTNDTLEESYGKLQKKSPGHYDAVMEKGIVVNLYDVDMLAQVGLSTVYRDSAGNFVKSLVTEEGSRLYLEWTHKASHDKPAVEDDEVAAAEGGAEEPVAAGDDGDAAAAAEYYKRRLAEVLGHSPSPPPKKQASVKSRDLREMFQRAPAQAKARAPMVPGVRFVNAFHIPPR